MNGSRKQLIGVFVGTVLVALLLSIGACQKSEQLTAPEPTLIPEIPQPEAVASIVTGGTLTEDFALQPPRSDDRRAPFAIWHCLKLDSAQRIAVLACLKTYRDSVIAILKTLRASEQPYRDQARQMRRAVLDSLRQGLLDRQTAWQRLREIAQWLREQLANNPVRQWALQELVRWKNALCECVAAVLTPEQQEIWQCWCSGGTDCCPGKKDPGGKEGDHDGRYPPVGPRRP